MSFLGASGVGSEAAKSLLGGVGGFIGGLGGMISGLGDTYDRQWMDEGLQEALSYGGQGSIWPLVKYGPGAVQDYGQQMQDVLGLRKAETAASRGDINQLLQPYLGYDPAGTYRTLRDEGVATVKDIGDYLAGIGRRDYAEEMARLGYAGRPTGSYAERLRSASVTPAMAALFGRVVAPGEELSRIGAEQRGGTAAGLGLIGARGNLIEQQAADATRASLAPIYGYRMMGTAVGDIGSSVAEPMSMLYEGRQYQPGWGTRLAAPLEGLGAGMQQSQIARDVGSNNPWMPRGQGYSSPYLFGMPGQGWGSNLSFGYNPGLSPYFGGSPYYYESGIPTPYTGPDPVYPETLIPSDNAVWTPLR